VASHKQITDYPAEVRECLRIQRGIIPKTELFSGRLVFSAKDDNNLLNHIRK
jgi:hypothetical protein